MDLTGILIPIAAIGGMALLFGGGLGYAAIKFAVPVDEKVSKILANLPGANCGGCGKAGCEAMARAMAKGECSASACPVCQKDQVITIAAILGQQAEVVEKKVAYVKCQGNREKAVQKFDYQGIQTCQDANLIGGGPKMCSDGCLGYGSCQQACPFGAITMKEGLPVIDRSICTGCGTCVLQCPRHIIEMVPENSTYHVACISREKGKAVKEACSIGCIGCGLCVRQCESQAIYLQDNHAVIISEKCIACGKCEAKCPTKAITHLIQEKPVAPKKEEPLTSMA